MDLPARSPSDPAKVAVAPTPNGSAKPPAALPAKPLTRAQILELHRVKREQKRLQLSRISSRVPEGFYTKAMFCAKLGIPLKELESLLRHGVVRPTKYSDLGWALFDEAALESVKKEPDRHVDRRMRPIIHERRSRFSSYTAAEAKRIFEAIDGGEQLSSLTTESNIHPSIIATIREDYARLNKAIVVSREVVEWLNRLEGKVDGVFPIRTSDELMRFVERLVSRSMCRCGIRSKKLCLPCARERLEDAGQLPSRRAAAEDGDADQD